MVTAAPWHETDLAPRRVGREPREQGIDRIGRQRVVEELRCRVPMLGRVGCTDRAAVQLHLVRVDADLGANPGGRIDSAVEPGADDVGRRGDRRPAEPCRPPVTVGHRDSLIYC